MHDAEAPAAIVGSLSLRDHFALGAGLLPTGHRVMAQPPARLKDADYEDEAP